MVCISSKHGTVTTVLQCGINAVIGKEKISRILSAACMVSNNELHLNPERRSGHLNGIFGDPVHGVPKVVAVRYHWGDGEIKEIVTEAKGGETVGIDLVMPHYLKEKEVVIDMDDFKAEADAPPAYDVVPSAPTEDFNEAPPGYNDVEAEGGATGNEVIASAAAYGQGNEVERWLRAMGAEYVNDYYASFMDQGFESMELVKTLNDDDLQNAIGIAKLGHRRKILIEIQKIN